MLVCLLLPGRADVRPTRAHTGGQRTGWSRRLLSAMAVGRVPGAQPYALAAGTTGQVAVRGPS